MLKICNKTIELNKIPSNKIKLYTYHYTYHLKIPKIPKNT